MFTWQDTKCTHRDVKGDRIVGMLLGADESVPHEGIGFVYRREDSGSVSEVSKRGKCE